MQKSSSNAGAKPRSKTPPPARSGNAAMTPLRRVAEATTDAMTPPPAVRTPSTLGRWKRRERSAQQCGQQRRR